MGSFYTNITIKGAEGSQVVEWLRSRGAPCFVEISDQGLVVFDQASEAQDGTHVTLAALLSSEVSCSAVAVLNHDDDVLRIDAFVDGLQVDHYDSWPNYFGEDSDEDVAPVGGEHLAALFGAVESEVEAALGADFDFATERHERLAGVLHLPSAACGFGFDHLSAGERPAPSGPNADILSLP